MSRWVTLVAALLLVGAASAVRADDPPVGEMDCVINARLLDELFTGYGDESLKTIRREGRFLHFQIHEGAREQTQAGKYSYVGLSGDFSIEVKYVWTEAPEVKKGYGMSCGIAIDTNAPAGNIFLLRTFSKDKGGSGYAIIWEKDGPNKGDPRTYETKIIPTKALQGRLALKREKKELICLAAEKQAELQEIYRIEDYTDAMVRQFRLYADRGGSPTKLDAYVGNLLVTAEEITGGFPKRERKASIPWFWIVMGSVIVGGLGWYAQRRGLFARKKEESPGPKKIARVVPKKKSKTS